MDLGGMMRKAHRSLLGAGGAVLLAASLLAVVPGSASAFPSGCTSTWDGDAGDDNWSTDANWSGNQQPGSTSVVCIGAPVVVDGIFGVAAVHLDSGAFVDVGSGGALMANGPATSVWASGSQVNLNGGAIGGTGVVQTAGRIDVFADSKLVSAVLAPGVQFLGTPGRLTIASGGVLNIDGALLWMAIRHRLDIAGTVVVTNDGRIAANWGTATTIASGGVLQLDGNVGYYQGEAVPNRSISTVTNNGLISKTQGGSTSIVDADYHQGAGGSVFVACCSTLAIAGQNFIGGSVRPDHGLGTAACGLNQFTNTCGAGSTNPAVDEMSLRVFTPEFIDHSLPVQVQELGDPAPTVDSRAVGNEVLANISEVLSDPSDPAILTLRYSQSDVMATPLAELQVAHVDDVTGAMTKVPDCDAGAIPTGEAYCIDRAQLTRTADNTFFRVLTTQTSRWHIRRVPVDGTFDQTATTAPLGLQATLGSPGDGSAVKLTWSPPADDGGAAPSKYRIFRDGNLVATTGGATSVVVKNSGPGSHVFKVDAVNLAGTSPKSGGASITLAKLSKPRQVTAVRGAAGGALTAGAKWQPPASAGGFVIKKYKVAAFTPGGRLVTSAIVGAAKRKFLFTLPRGRYVFKVKAKNADRWGPWSKPTAVVTPR